MALTNRRYPCSFHPGSLTHCLGTYGMELEPPPKVIGILSFNTFITTSLVRRSLLSFLEAESVLARSPFLIPDMDLSLNKWQQDWDSGDTGRAILIYFLKATLTPDSWSRESILFVTGHGPSPSYLYRFRLHHSDICTCGEKGPSPLRNFLSHDAIVSFYKTKCRKYSTLVEKRTFK
ncbi:hypothetical protein AVEN_144259-1 [Araneus ventricosus]|uniref:Uncharacterized protein n=1 Tax=Araneus ventricosus TaxID=182803 RepID=A0A4Y2P724_ARAVE|nr:hypothetical protein AVEN_144259-1 [Araneus ventricosus]